MPRKLLFFVVLLISTHLIVFRWGQPWESSELETSDTTTLDLKCKSCPSGLHTLFNGKNLIFGIGTGRCGTTSLSKLFSLQPRTEITHEKVPGLPWYANPCSRVARLEAWLELLFRRPVPNVGDVSFSYLPYVSDILTLHPKAKFLCLKRDRTQVIVSMKKLVGDQRNWHDIPPGGSPFYYNFLFPHFNDAKDQEEAIGKYWDLYYETVDELVQRYGEQTIRVVDMYSFYQDKTKQREVMNWLGFPDPVISTVLNP